MKQYNFADVEEKVLEFWQKNEIHKKAREKNKGNAVFYFLDGPPYTSGRVHIGTAWNKSLKDMVLRYKRMQGFYVWDRAGYDMHGMPTEQGVEKELGLKSKDQIINHGVEKFTTACREFAIRNMHLMNKDFIRLGVWMDFENAYQPITPEYIEGEWWLIKKAHENGRLYEGEKTMTWCARCATALAKHELEYKKVCDVSIFVKFPIAGKEKEFLIIWTTTPWTIPFNLGVMVNPDIEYVKTKVGEEIWIVAKSLAGPLIGGVAEKEFTILSEFLGSELVGVRYMHPFQSVLAQEFEKIMKESEKVHTVVSSREYVDTSAGSGLVHMAPGCGPEDYEVGHREGIPPFNTLDEQGVFSEGMGVFAGLKAKKDDRKFIDALEKTGLLIAKTKVEHDYAHCWRCKEPVIYRTTRQWFFKVEDLKEKMRELNTRIYWVPDYAGTRHFDSWLSNLRDNGITRQRFWGTPLPVWRCGNCSNYIVIGSISELHSLANKIPKDLHKPWIDEITIRCMKCGGEMHRTPDILDVWIDAGSASWNCLGFPQRKDLFESMYPADFILEGIDQIRGWFNLLFVASMVSMQNAPFKSVYMHGFVQDALGRKMSKSLGNYILPEEVISKYGADTLRYYMISGANPGLDINYNFDDMKVKHKNLTILWNLQNFILDLATSNNIKPGKIDMEKCGIEERYILSKLHSSIKKAEELYNAYYLTQVPLVCEELFLELSRVYVQLVREKVSNNHSERQLVLDVCYKVLIETLKIMAPIVPFITEEIYQNLKLQFGAEEESVHLCRFPKYAQNLIDQDLEKDISLAMEIVQAILSAREKISLGLRWPLKEAFLVIHDKDNEESVRKTEHLIKQETNIRKLKIIEKFEKAKLRVKPDYKTLGPEFGTLVPKIIAKLIHENEASLLAHLAKGKHSLLVDGQVIELRKEHFNITTELPQEYIIAEFSHGVCYINRERDIDLDSEGFARETMRRVQNIRKTNGLKKTDRIKLCISTDADLAAMLLRWQNEIKEKVGASEITIGTHCLGLEKASTEKIKDRSVSICFQKI
ncbi:MAG: isoleucine--tRNA ligase [Candidatus Woesearchaeota archaeon]